MTIATMVLSALMITLSTVSILPASPPRDVAAEVERQRSARQGARDDLDHAGAQWGGHWVAAMRLSCVPRVVGVASDLALSSAFSNNALGGMDSCLACVHFGS